MADQSVVHIGENSPEQVAYKLMNDILHANGKIATMAHVKDAATEEEIIRAYQIARKLVHGFKVDG